MSNCKDNSNNCSDPSDKNPSDKNPSDLDCAICYCPLKSSDWLKCGHRVHISCIQQQFKAECPLCRTPLDIQVFGTYPSGNLNTNTRHESGYVHPRDLYQDPDQEDENVYDHEFFSFRSGNRYGKRGGRTWPEQEYLYREEDPDYDEENPRGDSWDYEDV